MSKPDPVSEMFEEMGVKMVDMTPKRKLNQLIEDLDLGDITIIEFKHQIIALIEEVIGENYDSEKWHSEPYSQALMEQVNSIKDYQRKQLKDLV